MSTAITIRQLPVAAKQRLRMRAAANGRSMEAEARTILLDALDRAPGTDLTWIEQLMAAGQQAGGVELPEIVDEPATAADFGR